MTGDRFIRAKMAGGLTLREEQAVASLSALRCLAANLGMAGLLCASFEQGWGQGHDDACVGEGYSRWCYPSEWRPGCGRPMPASSTRDPL